MEEAVSLTVGFEDSQTLSCGQLAIRFSKNWQDWLAVVLEALASFRIVEERSER